METTKIPVTVYAEMTPNPATMKFVANRILVENGAVVEYTDPEKANDSPLAAKIFNFPFVEEIFIAGNFISVTKNDLVAWEDITLDLREYVLDYLSQGKPVFSEEPTLNNIHDSSQTITNEQQVLPQNEVEEKIIEIVEEYVRPAVEQDGGAIHFKAYKNGTLSVVLKGACSGCPSSTVTLKSGIQQLFNRMLPEVKNVIAEEQ